MPDIPEKIGRYEITDEVGRGGMGVVYKGRDPNIDRVVALKVIKLSRDEDPEAADLMKQRFQREASAAGKLQHPNIVTVYDAGEDDGVPFIAMEYVEGETLDKLLADDPMSLCEKAADIVGQIARAVQFAHDKGIVHRDIKAANIILAEDGTAKIMDFGIARVEGSDLTQQGTVMGSPSCMSPEQITGQQVDARSDVWGLGVALYHMLTGERPFLGESQSSITYKIVRIDPERPSRINPLISENYDLVVMKALQKRPADRYGSAAELADDLDRIKEGKAPEAMDMDRTVITGESGVQPVAPLPPEERRDEVTTSPEVARALMWGEKGLWRAAKAKYTILALLAALALVIIFSMVLGGDPWEKAEKYIKAEKHEKAAKVLEDIADDDPNDHRALYLLGDQLALSGDYREAVKAYSNAMALNPDYKNDSGPIAKLLTVPAGDEEAEVVVNYVVSVWGRSASSTLKGLLDSKDTNVRWNAAAALNDMGYSVSRESLLIKDLSDEDCDVRKAAVIELGETGSRRAIDDLEALQEKEFDDDGCLDEEVEEAIQKIKESPGGGEKSTPIKDLRDGFKKIFK